MALQWLWEDKVGCLYFKQGERKWKATLYDGNCTLIALNQKGKKYWLETFFADEKHMKVMLGLTKDNEGNYENYLEYATKLEISKKARYFNKIVSAFSKADFIEDFTIKIRKE